MAAVLTRCPTSSYGRWPRNVDVVLSWPVEPMIARAAPAIPIGDNWWYEPKFDGFRCITFARAGGRVRLQSRAQRSLTPLFPDLVEQLEELLPAGTVVDGELVVMHNGRVSFEALQRRSRGLPATLLAFDLLAHSGEDLRGLPLAERRARLADVVELGAPGLALVPVTADPAGASAWLQHGERGIEGVVAKRREQGYRPRRAHWSKIRAVATCEAVVGAITGSRTEPRCLILGRYDDGGKLRVIGRTGSLQPRASRELALQLHEPRSVHPWPAVLPASRFGLPGSAPLEHIPVEPEVVVEIEADSAFEFGRYRHALRFVRTRLDLEPGDVAAENR